MATDKKVDRNGQELFVLYRDEISEACERAVREALHKHKVAGNPVAISRDGKVAILLPDEIKIG